MKKSTKKDITKVIFRKWSKKEGGGIIAFFPEIPADVYGYDMQSYEHTGQHGGSKYELLLRTTHPATAAEYDNLFKELELIGYNLRIVKRATYADLQTRQEAAKTV